MTIERKNLIFTIKQTRRGADIFYQVITYQKLEVYGCSVFEKIDKQLFSSRERAYTWIGNTGDQHG